jgi:hypothetical protein
VNTKLKLLAATIALVCGSANAITVTTVQTNPGLFTTRAGVCTVDFNTAGSVSSCPGSTYAASGGIASHIVTGNLAGQYAQPAGDATPYLTLGPSAGSPVTISLAVGANYFGFYAGSIDSYNSIMFSAVGGGTVTLTGDQINAFLVPGVGANGSQNAYFNIFTDSLFNMVTLSSSSNAFETDNHSFGIARPIGVPEPASVTLLGLGALALVAGQRRRSRKQ